MTNRIEVGSLGDAFPEELERVKEALDAYRSIGSAGAFACSWIAPLVLAAEKATLDQDAVAMVRLYPELQKVSL